MKVYEKGVLPQPRGKMPTPQAFYPAGNSTLNLLRIKSV